MRKLRLLAGFIVVFNSGISFGKEPASKLGWLVIDFPSAGVDDSLTVDIFSYYLSYKTERLLDPSEIKKGNEKGRFFFEMPVTSKAVYFTLRAGNRDSKIGTSIPLLPLYIIEPGDSVVIYIEKVDSCVSFPGKRKDPILPSLYQHKNLVLSFTGRGAEKYKCRYEIDYAIAAAKSPRMPVLYNKDYTYAIPNFYSYPLSIAMSAIEKYRPGLSNLSYQLLKADMIGRYKTEELLALGSRIFLNRSVSDSNYGKGLKQIFYSYFNEEDFGNIDTEIKKISAFFPSFLLQKHILGVKLRNGGIQSQLSDLQTEKNVELREKMISIYFLEKFFTLDDGDTYLKSILPSIQKSNYRGHLVDLLQTVASGSSAYNFELPDINGKLIRLSDYRGKIVVVDFWFTGCGACLYYYSEVLSKVEEKYKNADVAFISISIDVDKKTWENSVNSGKYTSGTVFNLFTGGVGVEHPVINAFKVNSYPRPVLIDRAGKIVTVSRTDLRDVNALIRSIEKELKDQ